jgi:general secretion pathway protein C
MFSPEIGQSGCQDGASVRADMQTERVRSANFCTRLAGTPVAVLSRMTHSEQVRRYVRRGACLFTCISCAALIARGAVNLVTGALPPATSTKAPARREIPLTSGRALAEAVLTRNIFDAHTGALAWDGAATPPLPPIEPAALARDGELPACEGDMRLVAAMVVPHEPALSFVSIADAGQTLLYKPGMQVSGREVVGIREQRVFLRGASASTCQLSMFTPPAAAAPVVSASRAEKSEDARVTRQGESSFRIARSLFDEAIAGGSMMTSARVVPHRDGERVTGLTLGGIRRGSTLAQIGLQNGDVLQSINGHDLTSPDRALEAYTKLREADRFSVTLVRGGRTRSFEYTID